MLRVLRLSYEKLSGEQGEQIEGGGASRRGFDYSDGAEPPLGEHGWFVFEDKKYEAMRASSSGT